MGVEAEVFGAARAKRDLQAFRNGPLASFLGGDSILDVSAASLSGVAAEPDRDVVFAADRLQRMANYREALQTWFRAVRTNGYLVIVVPHAFLYERQVQLPSRWNAEHRRLYSPRSLLEEVEEALAPNSYRVRLVSDFDDGYDYRQPADIEPAGPSDILLVLEKIEGPEWELSSASGAGKLLGSEPDYAFEPQRTRIERASLRPRQRILILKLDHLGDFIIGSGALQKAREVFAGSEITLLVGSWNAAMAREMGCADHVVAFDVFPRNSSEEEVDVVGKTALFQALMTEDYDLAIDLRTDPDTRFLLRHVRAPVRAGIGTAAQFPFLDIFLPLDYNRNEPETAREDVLNHHAFAAQGSAKRTDHRVLSLAETVERDCAIVWGPYYRLRPGQYIFEPHVDIESTAAGVVMLDVALDAQRLNQVLITRAERVRLPFVVDRPDGKFEFRIWTVDDHPSLDLSFFGGRLIRQGAASVLHQSEYLMLLVTLIALRVDRTGVLGALNAAA